jgi:hypothetical protein
MQTTTATLEQLPSLVLGHTRSFVCISVYT